MKGANAMQDHCVPMTVLRANRAAEKLGIARSTFYAWQDPNSPHHKPSLPRPLQLGTRAVGWLESELDAWLAARAKNRGPVGASK
jgi:prophage regulatory protein